jgi:uncharacterized membrane protein
MLFRLFSGRMTNPGTWRRLGSLCLVLGILPRLFLPANWHSLLVHELSGVFLGMSLLFNFRFAWLARHQRGCRYPKTAVVGKA